jgi:uncharacterized metal-binding protein YceD (DUF177 family)
VEVPCDRCGDPLEQPIEGNSHLFIKFGEEPEEESDDVIIISDRDYQIDVSHYIYEFINLMLPAKRIHGEDENGESLCNPEAIKFLDENSGEQETDPRWDALKKLKNKEE